MALRPSLSLCPWLSLLFLTLALCVGCPTAAPSSPSFPPPQSLGLDSFLPSSLSLFSSPPALSLPLSLPSPLPPPSSSSYASFVNSLLSHIQSLQVTPSSSSSFNFTSFPPSFTFPSGSYTSGGHVNFADIPLARALRGLFVPDTNAFCTMFVMQFVLEALGVMGEEGGKRGIDGGLVTDEAMQRGVTFLSSYHDLYHSSSNVSLYPPAPVYTFWPFAYEQVSPLWWPQYNGSFQWQQYPENICGVVNAVASPPPWLNATLNFLLAVYPPFAVVIQQIQGMDCGTGAASMVSDFDDTSLHAMVGAALYTLRGEYPKAYDAWIDGNHGVNRDFSVLFDLFYAYRYSPFSADPNVNALDGRTYVWMYGFLNELVLANNNSTEGLQLNLISTWVYNQSLSLPWYSIPELANDVDLNVVCNSLLAIVTALTNNNPDVATAYPPHFLSLLKDSVMLVDWAHRNLTAVVYQDFASLFYPSKFCFYFLSARFARYVNTIDLAAVEGRDEGLHAFLLYTRETLNPTLQGIATQWLLSNASCIGANSSSSSSSSSSSPSPSSSFQYCFYDDFLGLADIPSPHYDDRLMSTLLATNALLDIWTTGAGANYSFLPHTPPAVRDTVHAALHFIYTNVSNPAYDLHGTFFSGSQHQSIGTMVPTVVGFLTWNQFVNICSSFSIPDLTPLPSNSNATTANFWPYWSSVAFTEALGVLAFTKGTLLLGNEEAGNGLPHQPYNEETEEKDKRLDGEEGIVMEE